jgi:hypothetical protein
MPFIPRHIKPPARLTLTCKVPVTTATVLKFSGEFLDSTHESVVATTLDLACRKDKECPAWLATTHPAARMPEGDSPGCLATRRDRLRQSRRVP